ncbi:MAG: CYTH domain-containing protein [Bacteroidales bacterium]|nr:CYTH domain-containing protein [Bacteroidales bacterium]
MTETERKFLVKGDFRKEVYASYDINQGYLCSDSIRTVRVRTKGPKGFITVKGRPMPGHLGRFEWEHEIPLEDAKQLLLLANPGKIEKTRHLVRNTDGVHIWEIDEFHGANEGLLLAEIELKTENDSFDRPEWLGKEVSTDGRYYNSYLSRRPYREWTEDEKH